LLGRTELADIAERQVRNASCARGEPECRRGRSAAAPNCMGACVDPAACIVRVCAITD
jgi:hypothetical protein